MYVYAHLPLQSFVALQVFLIAISLERLELIAIHRYFAVDLGSYDAPSHLTRISIYSRGARGIIALALAVNKGF